MSTAPTDADLEAKKGGMKKVETKTGGGDDPAALAAMAKLYTDNGGDLAKISAATGITFKDGATCKDADDFAKKMISGMIAAD
jgi:hypothetical protein